MATYAMPPDLDEVVIGFLAGHADLAPLHGGRVSTYLQSDDTSLRVTALGGVQPWPWRITSDYQLEAWGGEQHDANLLIRACLAAIYDLNGQHVADGYVTGVGVVLRPVWSPDEQTGRARYVAQIQLTAYPEETDG